MQGALKHNGPFSRYNRHHFNPEMREYNMKIQRLRSSLCGIGLLLWALCLTFACSNGDPCANSTPSEQCPIPDCTGEIGPQKTAPNGAACTKDCQCNNQQYWGICKDNKCVSIARTTCPTRGKTQECDLPASLGYSCVKGTQSCQPDGLNGLYWSACRPLTEQTEVGEACFDGLDNDCDGKIDADDSDCDKKCKPGEKRACFSGKVSNKGVGICAEGQQVCDENGDWPTICSGEVLPAEEECNGLDDDCDGEIDEELTAPACDEGTIQGLCAQATKRCGGSIGWITCNASDYRITFPEYEEKEVSCDGKDNDCDGEIDEELTPPTCAKSFGPCAGTVKRCGGEQGWLTCDTSDYLATSKDYEDTETSCDGIDNDCDGQIDNNLIAPPCDKQLGLCNGAKKVCGGANGWISCGDADYKTYDALYEADEQACDRLDNDCDGNVDENCACSPSAVQQCGSDIGTCKKGSQTCLASGKWDACKNEVPPSIETCNNKDNDCNGKIDDDVKQKCYSGASGTQNVGSCVEGTQTCTSGKWGACSGEIVPKAEVCDNKDNDCNGKIDDNITVSCYTGSLTTKDKGECKSGKKTCSAGKFGSCVGEVKPKTETCNNKDDDCDGAIDDSVRRSCYTGASGTKDVGTCKGGTQSCTKGVWGTCTGQVTPSLLDTCNGKDDDCDGSIDEAAFCPVGQKCTSGTCSTCSQPSARYDKCPSCNCGYKCSSSCVQKDPITKKCLVKKYVCKSP